VEETESESEEESEMIGEWRVVSPLPGVIAPPLPAPAPAAAAEPDEEERSIADDIRIIDSYLQQRLQH
jgi:hypothetical protein